MDKNWADHHTKKEGLNRREAVEWEKPKRRLWAWIMVLIIVIAVVTVGIGYKLKKLDGWIASGEAAYVSLVASTDDQATASQATTDGDASGQVSESLMPSELTPSTKAANPLSDRERQQIDNGIAHLNKQVGEQNTDIAHFDAIIADATSRKYTYNSKRVAYPEFMTLKMAAARTAKDSSEVVRLQLSLSEYNDKLQEMRLKRQHEVEVRDSLLKRIAVEQGKLP